MCPTHFSLPTQAVLYPPGIYSCQTPSPVTMEPTPPASPTDPPVYNQEDSSNVTTRPPRVSIHHQHGVEDEDSTGYSVDGFRANERTIHIKSQLKLAISKYNLYDNRAVTLAWAECNNGNLKALEIVEMVLEEGSSANWESEFFTNGISRAAQATSPGNVRSIRPRYTRSLSPLIPFSAHPRESGGFYAESEPATVSRRRAFAPVRTPSEGRQLFDLQTDRDSYGPPPLDDLALTDDITARDPPTQRERLRQQAYLDKTTAQSARTRPGSGAGAALTWDADVGGPATSGRTSEAGRDRSHAFVPDPLLPRATRDYKDREFRTKETLYIPGETVYYITESNPGRVNMLPVYIIGQVGQFPPKYRVAQDVHDEEDECWTMPHTRLFQSLSSLQRQRQLAVQDDSHYRHFAPNLFSVSKFVKSAADLILLDDEVSNVKNFYDAVGHALKASHAYSVDVLPPWINLRVGIPLEKLLSPPGRRHDSPKVQAFITAVGAALYYLFKGTRSKVVIDPRACPASRVAVDTCTETCGLVMLDAILEATIPKLGANIDVVSAIDNLSIWRTDDLASFMLRCSDCERTVRDAGALVPPNHILKKVLRILLASPAMFSSVSPIFKGFQQHQERNYDIVFQPKPVSYIMKELKRSGVNFNTRIHSAPASRSHPSTTVRPGRLAPGGRPLSRVGRAPAGDENSRLPFGARRPSRQSDGRRPARDRFPSPDRLENAGARRVRFNTPRTAGVELDDRDGLYDDSELNDRPPDEYDLESIPESDYDDEYDDPDINNVQAGGSMPKCTVCESREHETWECPLVDNINRTPALTRRINQARLVHKQRIFDLRARNPAYRAGPGANLPTPRHAALPAIPPPKVTAITAEQRAAHKASSCSSVETTTEPDYNYGDVLSIDDHAHIAELGQLVDETAGSSSDEAAIPVPITAAAQSGDPHADCAVPIHADYEEELHQADYNAFTGGSSLNY